MRLSIIILSNLFLATTTTHARAISLSQLKTRAAIFGFAPHQTIATSDSTAAKDVVSSITEWETDVNTVNEFLNNPTAANLNSAIDSAQNEPVQLGILSKVTGLSAAGQSAATLLTGNFDSVVSNLQNAQAGSISTEDATTAINFNRCCTILPAIGILWTAAAEASDAGFTPPAPQLEDQCASINCAAGASA